VSAAYFDLSDSELESLGYNFEATSDFIETTTIGASIARHDYVTISDTDITDEEDGKSAQVLGIAILFFLENWPKYMFLIF